MNFLTEMVEKLNWIYKPIFIFDEWLFTVINQDLSNPILSEVMTFITTLTTSTAGKITILVLLVVWVALQRKKALKNILCMLLVAGVCDAVAYWGIKSVIKRPRPHHIEEIKSEVRVPYAPKSPSFPSNHAVTTFGVMTVLAWAYPAYKFYFYLFAVIMAYSRVYVGVHFPLDVIVGGLLGIFIAKKIILKVFVKHPIFLNAETKMVD